MARMREPVPTSWDLKSVNKWWVRGMEKERARLTNAPKPAKGDRFGAPEVYSAFAPPLKPMKKAHAR